MTNAKAPGDMSAAEALEQYGFEKGEDGTYFKADVETQTWQPVAHGWRCLEAPTPGIELGAGVWGRPFKDTGLVEVPYRQSDKYEGVSGLHPATHPEGFEWVWPEAKVAEIYAYGYAQTVLGQRFRRNEEGELVQDRTRAGAEG